MAFVDGPSLAQSLVNGPWSARRSAELIAAVAEAIAFAHRRRVVHLDLKPANILLDPSGRARITDFGIARRYGLETNSTEGGAGTPQYMSPEQASGNPQAVGPSCDIYGIGAVLFTLLTGRPPFQGSTVAEILHHVLEQEPVSPLAGSLSTCGT